jgi:hypothetical protein
MWGDLRALSERRKFDRIIFYTLSGLVELYDFSPSGFSTG